MMHIALAVLLLVACTPDAEVTMEQATFAGGCFWCMQPPFENTDGVTEVVVGYAGGPEKDPTYEEVASGTTGHREAVQVTFDPKRASYKELLDIFWQQFDPTDENGTFADRGFQYTSAIYYHDDGQKRLAEESKEIVQKRFADPIVTVIEPYTTFFPAEDYHQGYHEKHPIRYKAYRSGSGREAYVANHADSIWEEPKYTKPSEEEIKRMLSPLQYKVTQEEGTEQPFQNEHWNNSEEGIYVDVVSGEPLFSSRDKYESGTGWPSFTQPLEPENIVQETDYKLIMPRTEVRSRHGDSHLGHVFKDGPEPTGLRYCMNSASLRFIPKDKLEEEGYPEYVELFTSS